MCIYICSRTYRDTGDEPPHRYHRRDSHHNDAILHVRIAIDIYIEIDRYV